MSKNSSKLFPLIFRVIFPNYASTRYIFSSKNLLTEGKKRWQTHMTNLSITERHTHTNHFHLSYSHILCAHILYIYTIHCWKEARRTDGTRARKILRARTMYLYFSFVDNPDIIHNLVRKTIIWIFKIVKIVRIIIKTEIFSKLLFQTHISTYIRIIIILTIRVQNL